MHDPIDIEDDDVQLVDPDASPYSKTKDGKSVPLHLLKPSHGEHYPTPSNAQPIQIPGQENVRRSLPPAFLQSAYGPSASGIFSESSASSRTNTPLNNNRRNVWGNIPNAKQAVPGIKANRKPPLTTTSDPKVYLQADGKSRIPIQGVKRDRETITVDDTPPTTSSGGEDTASKKPKIAHPGDNITSRHFRFSDSNLDRELHSRGIDDVFTQTLPRGEDLYSEFKELRVPGDQTQKKRTLIQPTVTKAAEKRNQLVQELEFVLPSSKVQKIHREHVRLKIGQKGLRFEDKEENFLRTIHWDEIRSVQVSFHSQWWAVTDRNGDATVMKFAYDDERSATQAFRKFCEGKIDQLEYERFNRLYITGSGELGTERSQPQVVITKNGKQLGYRLGSVYDALEKPKTTSPGRIDDMPRSVRGALEPITPPNETKGIEKRRPSIPATQRETRAQTSLKKNIPFLEYTATSRKGKITIYNDDLNRLNDEEFLNDTIIEFYLTYLFEEKLPDNIKEVTHIFNSFFWTNLTKKNPSGKRGHENVKKWTSKVDLFTKKYVVIPVNEAAHWYVAIICNLDQVQQRKETKPRTRSSQKDRMSPELGEDDTADDITIAGIEVNDEIVVQESPPPGQPEMADSKGEDLIEIPKEIHSKDEDVIEVPKEMDTKDEDVIEIPKEMRIEINEPIDVDSPSQSAMQEDFQQLSLSDEVKEYDYRNDPSVDDETRKMIDTVMSEPPRRYTRRDTTMLRDSPIALDDEPETITSLLKQRRNTASNLDSLSSPSHSRRISGKPIPFNSPVIILFDSLGLKHVPTIKTLRDYIVEEAKSKRDIVVSKDDIQGMHAKVPKQSNFCDCGVFLLHYVEKFLLDPDRYLPDMLSRVQDSFAPELTQESWGSGEVSQKRKQILELIQMLNYTQARKERELKAKEGKKKEVPTTSATKEPVEKSISPPPLKRRKEGGKLFDSRIDRLIELD